MSKSTNTLEGEVLTVLCGKENRWTWGFYGNDAYRYDALWFEKDGTGMVESPIALYIQAQMYVRGLKRRELTSRYQLDAVGGHEIYIRCEFQWSFDYQSTPPVQVDDNTWKFVIEMTLIKPRPRVPPFLSNDSIRRAPLQSAAFRPKRFSLTLSRGRFIAPLNLYYKPSYPLFTLEHLAAHRYRRKLTFDNTSPFPPREEWDEKTDCALGYEPLYDIKEVVRDRIKREDETWGEMLDLTWWLSPTIGQGERDWRERRKNEPKGVEGVADW